VGNIFFADWIWLLASILYIIKIYLYRSYKIEIKFITIILSIVINGDKQNSKMVQGVNRKIEAIAFNHVSNSKIFTIPNVLFFNIKRRR